MVPDDTSITRRRLLGGIAGFTGLAGGTTMVIGARKPTMLPDHVTDWATKEYPTPPEVNTLWRPTVTEDHAQVAVSLLADTHSTAERLWKRFETDEKIFTGDGGWLDDARNALQNGNYHEALFDATYGLQFAAEDLGFARAKLDDVDLQALAQRVSDLQDRVQHLANDLEPHPVVDADRDLAWYFEIESELLHARYLASWDGPETAKDGGEKGREPEASNYEPYEIGEIYSGLLRGRIAVENAERWRAHLSKKMDGETTAYDDRLRAVTTTFVDEIQTFQTRDKVESKFVDDDDPLTPYEWARVDLADQCLPSGVQSPFDAHPDDSFPVLQAVGLGTGVARGRAYEFAVDALVVDPGDEGFDSGHVLAEKRRARSVYQSIVGSDPSPLRTRLVGRAVEDLQVAKVGFADSYRDPMWKERLEAYLYALVGRAKLREFPEIHRTIVERP
jgi:hypothetical protein